MTRSVRLLRATAVLAANFLASCATFPDASDASSVAPNTDASTGADVSTVADATTSADLSTFTDAPTSEDTSIVTDASTGIDVSTVIDAPTSADASTVTDASTSADVSTVTDARTSADTSSVVDVFVSVDVSTEADAFVSGVPSLGSAAAFAVLGASTVTCINGSAVTGEVGVSPGTGLTGFRPSCTVIGTVHAGDALATQAHADLGTTYGALRAAVCEHDLSGTNLGGVTLLPGVYCFNSSVGLTGQLTLNGGGMANPVWIFQIASTLSTATGASVVMTGGGSPCNVFWQVGTSATIGMGTALQGNLIAYQSITLVSTTTVAGRALAVNAAVTMDNNIVSQASCP